MAEQRDESGQGQTAKLAQSRKSTQSSGATEPFATSDRISGDDRTGSAAGTRDKTSATVVRRKQRYLIGFRSLPGIMSLSADPFLERVSQMDGVEIVRRLPGSSSS
jgi:hypothetical protein